MKKKSYTAGIALTAIFGPLGSMYGSWWSGLAAFGLMMSIAMAKPELAGLTFAAFWLLSMCDVILNVWQHNRAVMKDEAKKQAERAELIAAIRAGHVI